MFQLSQESSVIYQEAVPLHHDTDLPRRRFYRYVRTSSSSSSSAMSSSSRMMTSSMTSSSASPVRRQAAPLSPRNRLDDGYDGTPARKVMALRQTTDYFLHVSTSSPHKAERPACGPACGPGPPSYGQWAAAKKGLALSGAPLGAPLGNPLGNPRGNGEVLKRSRIQTAYELSQDLQDKRIELLERKYGGVKARVAALTIQRAFRRYTLRNKFAAITAMAKAEKRLSRRLQQANGTTTGDLCPSDSSPVGNAMAMPGSPPVVAGPSSPGGPPALGQQQQGGPRAAAAPSRSMSMRERRLPRSQSSCCGAEPYEYCGPCGPACGPACAPACGPNCGPCGPCPPNRGDQHEHDGSVTYWDSTTAHFYSPHESYSEHDMSSSMGPMRGLAPIPPPHGLAADPWTVLSPCPCPGNCPCPSPSPSSSPAGSVASGATYQGRGSLSGSHSQHRGGNSKVPPDVPKRTSSITPLPGMQGRASLASLPGLPGRLGGGSLGDAGSVGSVTSVHSAASVGSAGSDSSSHTATASAGGPACDQQQCEEAGRSGSPTPLWRRKDQQDGHPAAAAHPGHPGPGAGAALQAMHQLQQAHQAQLQAQGQPGAPGQPIQQVQQPAGPYAAHMQESQHVMYKVSETVRKRQYRVGLNLFNKKPERGISYLIRRGFLENSPQGVARFLISRKGLSKQMIGEYLGNLQSPFNMAVLECFADELDLCGMAVDVGLRKFQSHFRMPGEAQKIERLMEVFSTRYCRCNQDVVARLRSPDTVFVLAFAIIMLNTDLHTPNIKPERRMKLDDFIKNLRGIDDCHDIDKDMLAGIYDRVKANEFKPGSDHVTQVMKVQSTIVGKKPNMALPHRRLVCYCRLYEVPDPYKKERPGVHQREVFLFNDLLVITKILSKKKNSVTYTFRQSFPLCGMMVTLFDVPYYPYGIRLSQRVDGKVLVTFNARNEHDRCKFAEDLRESVCEMDEMENLRIEAELERQKSSHAVRTARAGGAGSTAGSVGNSSDNRDSGVADVEGMYACGTQENCARGESEACGMEREQRLAATDVSLKRSALSNSLLDIHEQFAGEKPQRRGSVGSLDSGMSISFQSTSASTVSRDSSPQNVQPSPGAVAKAGNKGACHIPNHPHQMQQPLNHALHPVHQGHLSHPAHPVHPGQPSLLGGMFVKRDRKVLRDENSPYSRSTEV